MKTKLPVTFRQLDASMLLVQWPSVISREVLEDMMRVQRALQQERLNGVTESFFSYQCLAIAYDSAVVSSKQLIIHLEEMELNFDPIPVTRWTLPVCYDPTVAPDLEAFCLTKKLDLSQLISLHASAVYTVYFLGFLPGFLYLGGLDEKLHLPRKAIPDRKILSGSVGVGGPQTGIYPQDSPGGWHVIGHCPVPLFRPDQSPPVRILPGDEVVFQSVSMLKLQTIREQLQADSFVFQNEQING